MGAVDEIQLKIYLELGGIELNSREKIRRIFDHKGEGLPALWVGHPNEGILQKCADEWGIAPEREAIFEYLRDDCRWITADGGYRHPEGLPVFDMAYGIDSKKSFGDAGCFAECEDIRELDRYPWPDPGYCDFTEIYKAIEQFPDKMVFTGLWSPFFHIVSDFFGMENYFIKMYENPLMVEAVTERVVDYFVEANERFFSGLGNRADVMFFGNDFGTQLDLLISPENFRRFVMPSFKRLIAVGKKYHKKIMLHSCGSIYRIIPDLIDAGVDILHPIQAQAQGMDALSLAQYKEDLCFVGGIDAQSFFVNAAPSEIKEEVRRVRELLGPGYVVSPSHEEILPNVPPQNILAMAEAAWE